VYQENYPIGGTTIMNDIVGLIKFAFLVFLIWAMAMGLGALTLGIFRLAT
jgi:hypothetical protein